MKLVTICVFVLMLLSSCDVRRPVDLEEPSDQPARNAADAAVVTMPAPDAAQHQVQLDAGLPVDSGVVDSGFVDSGVADSGVADSGEPMCANAGGQCYGVDQPCCEGLICSLDQNAYGIGFCIPPRQPGEFCQGHHECAAGRCVDGICG